MRISIYSILTIWRRAVHKSGSIRNAAAWPVHLLTTLRSSALTHVWPVYLLTLACCWDVKQPTNKQTNTCWQLCGLQHWPTQLALRSTRQNWWTRKVWTSNMWRIRAVWWKHAFRCRQVLASVSGGDHNSSRWLGLVRWPTSVMWVQLKPFLCPKKPNQRLKGR